MSERKYDPRRPYKVWLECFNDFPESERPTFTYRRASADEWDQIADAVDAEANQQTDPKSVSQRVFSVASIGLMGWDRQVNPATGESVPFDIGKLRSVINTKEAVELCELRLQGSTLTLDEKKTSE